MAAASVIVLWLAPAEPAREFFCETIRRLALEHDAPLFEPHLTLGLGGPEQLPQVEAAPIELPVLGIDYSEAFTKTLFVRFARTAALAELRNSLGMEAAGYDPHLSLLYRKMPATTKNQLAASISIPFSSVTFNAIAAVRCPARIVSRDDVESWEAIAAKQLA